MNKCLAMLLAAVVGCANGPRSSAMDTLDWKPSWPGTQMAVLLGNPSGEGPFIFRFRMPGGYWIHPHRHPVQARIRVVSGTFLVGMGAVLDSTSVTVLPAGNETTLAPGMIHFEGTRGETVVEVRGDGPWGITFLTRARTPRRRGRPIDSQALPAYFTRTWEMGPRIPNACSNQMITAITTTILSRLLILASIGMKLLMSHSSTPTTINTSTI